MNFQSDLQVRTVSYAVLLQGTMELTLELVFVMCEEITMTDSCLHGEVRIFPGVSTLGVSSARGLVHEGRYNESW